MDGCNWAPVSHVKSQTDSDLMSSGRWGRWILEFAIYSVFECHLPLLISTELWSGPRSLEHIGRCAGGLTAEWLLVQVWNWRFKLGCWLFLRSEDVFFQINGDQSLCIGELLGCAWRREAHPQRLEEGSCISRAEESSGVVKSGIKKIWRKCQGELQLGPKEIKKRANENAI